MLLNFKFRDRIASPGKKDRNRETIIFFRNVFRILYHMIAANLSDRITKLRQKDEYVITFIIFDERNPRRKQGKE